MRSVNCFTDTRPNVGGGFFSRCFSRLRVETVDPVREEVVDEVDDGADAPGQRIGPVDVAYLPEEPRHQLSLIHI